MNINDARRNIMFNIFAIISFIGFFILISIVAIDTNGLKFFILSWLVWVVCVILTVTFYDPKIIKKHIFAIIGFIIVFIHFIFAIEFKDDTILKIVVMWSNSWKDVYCNLVETYLILDSCRPTK